MSTRSTFKLCFKNEVLWQIIILEMVNPLTFSISGHPVLAVRGKFLCLVKVNFSLLLRKILRFTKGLPGKLMEAWQGIRDSGRGFFICMRHILGVTFCTVLQLLGGWG